MAKLTTITYDLAGGNTDIPVQGVGKPLNGGAHVSMHVQGDAGVDGTATIKLQESNIHASGLKDVVDMSQGINVSSSSYVAVSEIGGAFLSINVVLGTATAGIATITLNYV